VTTATPQACKALVVNGLNRSGTTMAERLLDSQSGIICMDQAMQMVRVIALMRLYRDKAEIMTEDFTHGANVISEQSYRLARVVMADDFWHRIAALTVHPEYIDPGHGTLYGLSRVQIFDLLDMILGWPDPNDVGGLLAAMGGHVGVGVMGTKWTVHHRYAPVFLRNPEAWWLEVVRHPYARLSSERLSHGGDRARIFAQQQDSLRFVAGFSHPRYKVMRYEDLCADPEGTLAEVSEWLGHEVSDRPLVNPLGGPFYPNTSDHTKTGRDIFHQDTNLGARIGGIDPDRWRARLSAADIALINRALDFCGLFEKEPTPFAAALIGGARYAALAATTGLRETLRRALTPTGYTLARVHRPRPI